MNMTHLLEKLHTLPEHKQLEVMDFVDYLASRFAQPQAQQSADWLDAEFACMSMTQALRGLHEEPDLYQPSDLKERWQ